MVPVLVPAPVQFQVQVPAQVPLRSVIKFMVPPPVPLRQKITVPTVPLPVLQHSGSVSYRNGMLN